MIVAASPAVMNFRSTLVTVINGYCPPGVTNCGANDMIHNFILTGELGTQINDVATGCSANSYNDRTSQSITLYTGRTYTVQVNSLYPGGQNFAIWIDFNGNFQFDTNERVASTLLVGTTNNAVSIVIPTISGGATTGVRRMRATVAYSVAPNQCQTATSYGETHDYTVNILQRKRLIRNSNRTFPR